MHSSELPSIFHPTHPFRAWYERSYFPTWSRAAAQGSPNIATSLSRNKTARTGEG